MLLDTTAAAAHRCQCCCTPRLLLHAAVIAATRSEPIAERSERESRLPHNLLHHAIIEEVSVCKYAALGLLETLHYSSCMCFLNNLHSIATAGYATWKLMSAW
jgi:hypothetical protein